MTASQQRQLPLDRIYLYGQLAGWGGFLILRLFITASYCSKTPGANVLDACLLETFSHLLGAAWSHATWLWMKRRRLVDRGYRRLRTEGLVAANLGTIPLVAATWAPTKLVYAYEVGRFGSEGLLGMLVGQNTLITALWFYAFVALLYFDRARRLELEHAEARATAREAQLHALRGQINPHFLFNSFNSLRALIALDPARASEALTQLSGLLRYSLAAADRLVVPLAEELQVVRRYLDLEKLRLGDRLAVAAELPGETDGALIPPMLLQGLVENAVKFGPAARKSGGEIAYRVVLESHHLRLRVTNPGRLGAGGDSTGLGLRNLRDRLRLLYGETAAFSLREEGEDRVVAEVAFPLRPATIVPANHRTGMTP